MEIKIEYISADFITTGTLTANLIRAGLISDADSKNSWNLDTGVFTSKQGTIGGFTISSLYLKTGDSTDYFQLGYSGITIRRENSRGDILNFYFHTNGDGLRLLCKPNGQSSACDCPQIVPYATKHRINNTYYAEGIICADNAIRFGDYGDCIRGENTFTIFIDEPPYVDAGGSGFLSVSEKTVCKDGLYVRGDLKASGTKSRIAETDNYSERLLYCYETPTPIFGDLGETVIDSDGLAYVDIDDIFSETIAGHVEYQVFLQKEGAGDCWISDKQSHYFVIEGTPGLRVAWELKAKQRGYQNLRLDNACNNLDEYQISSDLENYLNGYIEEQEGLLYG